MMTTEPLLIDHVMVTGSRRRWYASVVVATSDPLRCQHVMTCRYRTQAGARRAGEQVRHELLLGMGR